MREEAGQTFELSKADPCVHVGQIELAAREADVARTVREPLDAVEAQDFDALRLLRIVDDEGAALDRRHVLVRVEAEADEVADRADRPAVEGRSHDERCVFDDAQLAVSGKRIERIEGDERARPVRRHDRARARADARRDGGEVDVARDWIAIDEHRRGALLDDHVRHGEEALRAGDHLVAAADTAELQRNFHGGRRRRDDADRAGATECGQRRLESLDPHAARDVSRAQHVGGGGNRRFVEERARELERRRTAHGFPFVSMAANCAPRARRRQ